MSLDVNESVKVDECEAVEQNVPSSLFEEEGDYASPVEEDVGEDTEEPKISVFTRRLQSWYEAFNLQSDRSKTFVKFLEENKDLFEGENAVNHLPAIAEILGNDMDGDFLIGFNEIKLPSSIIHIEYFLSNLLYADVSLKGMDLDNVSITGLYYGNKAIKGNVSDYLDEKYLKHGVEIFRNTRVGTPTLKPRKF